MSNHIVRPIGWLLAGLLLCLGQSGPLRAGEYRLGVVPQLPTLELHRRWQPLLNHLREQYGLPLMLRIHSSIPEFEAALRSGDLDFAYLNPYHQLVARQWQGYQPLVRDTGPLTGILVVRTDGPIQGLSDLRGGVISFPSPNAFGASLYLRALLRERHGIDFQARYARTHANVYRQVIYGDAVAGGGVWRTLNAEPESIREKLQVVFETPPVAPHPVAVHPRVSRSVRRRVLEAFLRLPETETGRALLASIQMPAPMEASYERDYAPLQSLNLEHYFVEPELH